MDDCVPTFLNSKIAFAQPMNGVEIWVCIIEKAWAKLSKSYANTEGGLPGEVMHCLSGAPTQLYIIPEDKTDIKALEKVWSSLLRNYNKGYLLCCGTVPDPTIESSGWVPSHAYTIVSYMYNLVRSL